MLISFPEQREATGRGSRPKTSAGLQLLFRSILSEIETLKERKQTWLKSIAEPIQRDVAQVEAILADLERKLNEILKNIAELRKMWETTKRKESAHSRTKVNSSTESSAEDMQLPQIKDTASFEKEEKSDERASADSKDSTRDSTVPDPSQENRNKRTSSEKILKRRESTFMMPTKQRTNRTRQKLAELQTKGMSPEQLRNYYRERSFLNSVARRGSLHADADKRLLDGLGSNTNPKPELSPSVEEESLKQGKQQRANQKIVPTWTKDGIMGLRRETTLSFIRRGNLQSVRRTSIESVSRLPKLQALDEHGKVVPSPARDNIKEQLEDSPGDSA